MMRNSTSPVAAALLRAIARQAGLDGRDREKPIIVVEDAISTEWASATFIGATHSLLLRLEGSAAGVADAFHALVDLAESEIAIPGQIVAELVATPGPTQNMADSLVSKTLTVNALTIID